MGNPFKAIGNAIGKAFETVKDVGEQALTAVGLKDKDAATYSINADGSLNHNVDLEDFPPEMRAEAEALIDGLVDKIEAKRAEVLHARDMGDMALVEKLQGELDGLNEKFTDVKFELEHIDPDLVTLSSAMGPIGFWGLAAEGFRYNSKLADCLEDAKQVLGVHTGEISRAGGGSQAASAGGTSSSEGTAGFETVEQAMELFETDEKAFFEKLQEVRAEDRGAWLMAIQTKLQATNQLVTSITNFQKAQHDTQKAVLANMRV